MQTSRIESQKCRVCNETWIVISDDSGLGKSKARDLYRAFAKSDCLNHEVEAHSLGGELWKAIFAHKSVCPFCDEWRGSAPTKQELREKFLNHLKTCPNNGGHFGR